MSAKGHKYYFIYGHDSVGLARVEDEEDGIGSVFHRTEEKWKPAKHIAAR